MARGRGRGRAAAAAGAALAALALASAGGLRGAEALRVVREGAPGLLLEPAGGAPELEGLEGPHGRPSHEERCKRAQAGIKRRSTAELAAMDKAEKAGKLTKKQAAEKRAVVKERTSKAEAIWQKRCGKHGDEAGLEGFALEALEAGGPGGRDEKCEKAYITLEKKYKYEMAAIAKAEEAGKITKKQAAEKRAIVNKRFGRAKREWEQKCGDHGGRDEKCEKAYIMLEKKYKYEMAAIAKAEEAGKITKNQAAEKRAVVNKRFGRAKRAWERMCGDHGGDAPATA